MTTQLGYFNMAYQLGVDVRIKVDGESFELDPTAFNRSQQVDYENAIISIPEGERAASVSILIPPTVEELEHRWKEIEFEVFAALSDAAIETLFPSSEASNPPVGMKLSLKCSTTALRTSVILHEDGGRFTGKLVVKNHDLKDRYDLQIAAFRTEVYTGSSYNYAREYKSIIATTPEISIHSRTPTKSGNSLIQFHQTDFTTDSRDFLKRKSHLMWYLDLHQHSHVICYLNTRNEEWRTALEKETGGKAGTLRKSLHLMIMPQILLEVYLKALETYSGCSHSEFRDDESWQRYAIEHVAAKIADDDVEIWLNSKLKDWEDGKQSDVIRRLSSLIQEELKIEKVGSKLILDHMR